MTRSSPRASIPDQRGFVLIAVLVIAILYLALIELMLMDSAATLRSAARFRSWAVARTMAENGADLAAQQMLTAASSTVEATTDDGRMNGSFRRNADDSFEITASGSSSGVQPASARVTIEGRIVGNHVTIDRSIHTQ